MKQPSIFESSKEEWLDFLTNADKNDIDKLINQIDMIRALLEFLILEGLRKR